MDKSNAYRKSFEAKLEETRARMDALKARTKGASAEAEIRLKNEAEQLEKKFDDLRDEAAKLAQTTDETFEKVKGELERKWNDYTSKLGDLTRALSSADQKKQASNVMGG